VTPEQSEKLALAQNQGTIHFVLRNGGDSANVEVPPVDMAGLTGIVKKPPQPDMKHVKQVAAMVRPPVYTIETVVNGKTTIATFPVKPE